MLPFEVNVPNEQSYEYLLSTRVSDAKRILSRCRSKRSVSLEGNDNIGEHHPLRQRGREEPTKPDGESSRQKRTGTRRSVDY